MRIYYDIETTQSDQFDDRDNWMEHKPNLLICQQVCDDCEHVDTAEHVCVNCGEREHIFDSLDHMQLYTLGIVPRGGYRGRDKQSFMALKWLDYEQHKLGDKGKIITAENGREVRVMGRPVDGYTEITHEDGSTIKTIYQFHGCFFHHCRKCFPNLNVRERLQSGQVGDPYEQTKRITSLFRSSGYKVKEIWECDFVYECNHNPTYKAYYAHNTTKRSPPLKVRDALCGGRTSALRSYKKADLSKGEKIKFYDVCSEYPFCNFKSPYPFGHPEIFLEDDPNTPKPDEWNGVIKATVLPPQDLFLPVLPYKCCSKLMFPLCRSCAENQIQDECTHDEDQRTLTGTWCANELQLAVKKNYRLMKVHEVYQYPGVKVYDHDTKTDGLFSSYVRENMALKIEASGWPSHVKTDAQKDQYIQDIYDRDGIVIRMDRVEKNPGKRFLAKLILNSFWGKMGEKTLRSQTVFVFDYGELISLCQDSTITINSILPIGEDCLQINFIPVEDMEDSLKTTSLIHAAFTTAHGRLLLYKYLDVVGERALYHDTDSVCFLSVPGEPEPQLGQYLGDLTDQLADDYGENSFCTEFVSSGAKSYSFRVAVGGDLNNIKTVIKVRGISINSSCTDTVTFDRLKEMVFETQEHTTIQIPTQIARLPGWRIVSRPSSKKWQVCLNKRRCVCDGKTVPFGFTGTLLDDEDYSFLQTLDDLENS
ncbi:hypothetical protein ONE63_000997 [Megalurothrips usitatus]|uniref:DNA-directed DNA polymerase n=1 Tax=Megalurothrips usitatus TaxID=439358 RepID=A0AAV7XDV3_9NEOP|nr:hypothetical protein ONE63_000997 [Megalurothrips usitatus]